jgi:hypothetical protein
VRPGGPGAAATQVIVVATLGSTERRLLRGRRPRVRESAPEPSPTPVVTGRVTVIDAQPGEAEAAERWLAAAGPDTATPALIELGRLVRAHRISSADPGVPLPRLTQALVVRVGYGAGEEVAHGRWTEARELPTGSDERTRRRSAALRPQERIAALLSGRSRALACEELALRARHDLDHEQLREAALQLRTALDAALAELPVTPQAQELTERIEELRTLRGPVVALADEALAGALAPEAAQTLEETLRRLEAALRARTVAEGR